MREKPLTRGQEAVGWTGLAAGLVLLYLWQVQVLGAPAPGEKLYGIALLAPIAVGILTIALLEWRARAATRFLALSLGDGRRAAALLLLILAAGVKLYFVPGWRVLQGDGLCHTTAAWIAYDSLARGELPIWSNAWAAGFPFLLFYPPLFSLGAAALAFVTHDVMLASRLLLAAAQIASGVGMYLFAMQLARSRAAAIVAAIAFALAPWHGFQAFHWNRFPTALVWGLLPWPFWLYERGRTGRRWAGTAGLVLALVFLAHHGYAAFASVLFGLYVLLRSISWESGRISMRWRDLTDLVWAGAGSAALSGFFWIPYAIEGRETFELPSLSGAAFFLTNRRSLAC